MRTQEEIVLYMEKVSGEDFLGFIRNGLISYLNFENAKPYLKEGTTVKTTFPEAFRAAL